MVHYIFSDKTGTLTQNIMEFKKFSAGRVSYGLSNPSPQVYANGITNVNFQCPLFQRDWDDSIKENGAPAIEYLETMVRILAICHTIIVDEKNGTLVYNASSPDELALTNAARHFGLKFNDRDEDGNMLLYNRFTDQVERFELLNVIEFTSTRKRMTVIVRSP